MIFSVEGRRIAVSASQEEKAQEPISVKPSGSVTPERLLQFRKASGSIFVTVFGRVIAFRASQFAKARFPSRFRSYEDFREA